MRVYGEIDHTGYCKRCVQQADARALWAVRVLDAWQTANPDTHAFATYIAAHGDWRCASHSYYRHFNGPTPDAARIAAAEALVAADPELDPDAG